MFDFLRKKDATHGRADDAQPAIAPAIRVADSIRAERVSFSPLAEEIEAVRPEEKRNEIADKITTDADLPLFARTLYDDANLSEEFRHLLCPVEIEPAGEGKKARYAIILRADMIDTDETAELVKLLSDRYERAEPFYYPAAPQIVVALAREGSNANGRRVYTGSRTRTGALWSSFEEVAGFGHANGTSDIIFNLSDTSEFSSLEYIIDGYTVTPSIFNFKTKDLADTLAHVFQRGEGSSHGEFGPELAQQTSIKSSIGGRDVVFRWASMKGAWGPVITMRMVEQFKSRDEVPTFEKRGYLPDQCDMLRESTLRGTGTVVAGTVNSGKTATTLTAMAEQPEYLNRMTFEDPIENYLPGVKHFTFSRRLGDRSDDAFLIGQQQLKRMNPHYMHVGELRDHQSGALYRDVTGAGVRSTTTVHAPSCVATPARLSDAEIQIPRDVLGMGDFISLYVYQALLHTPCKHCAIRDREAHNILGADYLRRLDRLFGIDVDAIRLRNPEGCPQCRRFDMSALYGIRGRTAVAEMFPTDDESLQLIRTGNDTGLKAYIRSWKTTDSSSPVTLGKSIYEVAMHRVHLGHIDPRTVEARFGSLHVYERARNAEASRRANLHVVN